MKKELDEALCRDFPNLYSSRKDRNTCMIYGFDVGDGWEPILRELSGKLERIILAMPEADRAEFHAFQVKEKFGGLRFYMSRHNDEIDTAIKEAEIKCAVTCEDCGKSGTLDRTGPMWLATQCSTCRALARNKRIVNNSQEKNPAQDETDEDS